MTATALPPSPDVLVIGAGPGGLATALWCKELGLSCAVVEAAQTVGGQLLAIPHAVHDLPGVPATSGAALRDTLVAQVARAGVPVLTGVSASLDAHALRVETRIGESRPGAVVIATGVRRRRLDVPGEETFAGEGVRWNVGDDLARWRGLRVVVIGGGDDALVHATLLVPVAASVALVFRRAAPSARRALVDAVLRDERITRIAGARVLAFEGDRALGAVRLDAPDGVRVIDADVAFVCAGPTPRSEGFGVARRPDGSVIVDRLQRTSRMGVFAVGDVCTSEAPTIATAFGQGATAAKTICAIRDGALRDALPTPATTDLLRLHALRFPARVGAYPRERALTQTLRFDVTFAVETARAASTDQLEHALDYSSVVEAIATVLERRHYHLIESVADAVASELLARFAIERVDLTVTKPAVPQAESEASITVSRARPERVRS